jgi:hypothetical protein
MLAMINLAKTAVIFATASLASLELGWAVDKNSSETLMDGDGPETLMDRRPGRRRRYRSRSFHVCRTIRPTRVRTGTGANGSGLEGGLRRGGGFGSARPLDGGFGSLVLGLLFGSPSAGDDGLGTGNGLLVGVGSGCEPRDAVTDGSQVLGLEDGGDGAGVAGRACNAVVCGSVGAGRGAGDGDEDGSCSGVVVV